MTKELDLAAALLDVKPDEIGEFCTEDLFNNNIIHGYLCRRSDYRYGALVIFQVNKEKCRQVIYCTPKMHYPFDKNGEFHWPAIQEIQSFDKLDGTNILAYKYIHNDKEFLTYKTRLTPTLGNSDFGSFYDMWREMLQENLWIEELINKNSEYNLSFELYGSRNPISVKYDTALDVAFLFGVRRLDHVIKPPTKLELVDNCKLPEQFTCSGSNFTDVYNSFRLKLTQQNYGCENEEMFNIEGMMLYAKVENDPSWRQFKLKAEQIEKLHWSASGVIPKLSLWTTILNSYESNPNPTYDYIVSLLKEEYSDSLIIKSSPRIEHLLKQSAEHMKFIKIVNEVWHKAKENDFDIIKDKAATLRWMSQFFSKSQMRKVGSVILKQAGLLK